MTPAQKHAALEEEDEQQDQTESGDGKVKIVIDTTRKKDLVKRAPKPEQSEAAREQRVNAVNARWLARDATEAEVRQGFMTMPLEDAVSMLAAMRKHCELAAETLNMRKAEEVKSQRCTQCGGPSKKNGLWVMEGSTQNPDTGLFDSFRYCDIFCVRERNRKTMMPAGADKHRVDGREMGDIG